MKANFLAFTCVLGYSLQASAREYQYESLSLTERQERLFIPLSKSLSFL